MPADKNKHWKDIKHNTPTSDWATAIEYRLLPAPSRTAQIARMQSYLGSTAETNAKVFEIEAVDENRIKIGAIVEARDEFDALDSALATGLGALASTEVDLELVLPAKAGVVPKLSLPQERRDNPMVASGFPVPQKLLHDEFHDQVEIYVAINELTAA